MKGLIVLPSGIAATHITIGRYMDLFLKIKDKFNFDITNTNRTDPIGESYNVVLSFKNPQKGAFNSAQDIIDLPNNVKLISYFTDLHSHRDVSETLEYSQRPNDIRFSRVMKRVLERSDIILTPYMTFFERKWPELKNKVVHFPHFINAEYIKMINLKKSMQCILSGASDLIAYPFRNSVARSGDKNVYVLDHPGYRIHPTIGSKYKVGEDYCSELSKFYCGLATPSVLGYPVAKYIEVPACGCLMLAEYTDDLDRLGFVDGENYLKTTKETFHDDLDFVLKFSKRFNQIAINGHKHVMNNYTIDHSVDRFGKVLDRL